MAALDVYRLIQPVWTEVSHWFFRLRGTGTGKEW